MFGFFHKDNPKKIEKLKNKADQGNRSAQFKIATYFFDTKSKYYDLNKAIKYFTLSADQGYKNSQLILGMYYYYYAFKDNESLRIKYLDLLVKKGNQRAKLLLGITYKYAENPDYDKAFKLIKEAYDKKVKTASVYLGEMYDNGLGVEMDKRKAFELYLKEVDENPLATIHVSQVYGKGEIFPVDEEKSSEYFKKGMYMYKNKLMRNELDKMTTRLFYILIGDSYKGGYGVAINNDRAKVNYSIADDLLPLVVKEKIDSIDEEIIEFDL